MVDALHEAHRVLRDRGLMIDARPDSRERAPLEHVEGSRRRVVGTVNTTRGTAADDRCADRAIARVTRDRLFRSRRAGGFVHRMGFEGLADMHAYLRDHGRLVARPRWSVDAATRRRWRDDRFSLRRPIRYELLDRIMPRS